MRLRRSELSTPGSSDKMLAKAAASDADLVFCDLEDAVAPAEKEKSRPKIIHALTNLDWRPPTRAIRMNAVDTPYAHGDVIEVVEGAREALDLIIVPKAKTARDVWWVATLLDQLEPRLGMTKRIALEVLIEEVEALINAEEIACSTPRLEALIFGPGDFSASQGVTPESAGGVSPDYPGDVWHYARNKVVVAARAARIDAVDGPFADFNDPDGYHRECLRSRTLGFVGKWAIHPNQIPTANDVYSPTETEERQARRIVAAYEDAERDGRGSAAVDGQMIDIATARIQRAVVEKADLIRSLRP